MYIRKKCNARVRDKEFEGKTSLTFISFHLTLLLTLGVLYTYTLVLYNSFKIVI